MNFRVNDLQTDKWANALEVSFQGCLRRCRDCPNNGSIRPMYGGKRMDTEEIKKALMKDPALTRISFVGGEPFLQPLAALDLARFAHAKGKAVWCRTHYHFEQILQWGDSRKTLLREVDVLLDEPHSPGEDESGGGLGERKHRRIDVKKSLEKGEVLLYDTE